MLAKLSQVVRKINSEFPYSSINQNRYKTFNQFEEPVVNANPVYAQYANPVPQKKQELEDEDEIGEFIYTFVERMFPQYFALILARLLRSLV